MLAGTPAGNGREREAGARARLEARWGSAPRGSYCWCRWSRAQSGDLLLPGHPVRARRVEEPRSRVREEPPPRRLASWLPSSQLPRRCQSAATVRRRDPLYGEAPRGSRRRLSGSLAFLRSLAMAGSGQLPRMPRALGDARLLPGPLWGRKGGTLVGAGVAGEARESGAPSPCRRSPRSSPRTGAWERV